MHPVTTLTYNSWREYIETYLNKSEMAEYKETVISIGKAFAEGGARLALRAVLEGLNKEDYEIKNVALIKWIERELKALDTVVEQA